MTRKSKKSVPSPATVPSQPVGAPALTAATGPDAKNLARRVAPPLLLLVLVAAAYLPAVNNGWVWDDDDYVTANENLRDADGLRQIWTKPGAVTQYYPLVYTTYWLEHHAWGDWAAPYHAANILLHAINAMLVWLVLRRLGVPGALLAAAVFAAHPVHVESVAWITERKNVLSGMFYLLAALAYLRYAGAGEGETRGTWRSLVLSFVLLAMALLSKSITATLPVALLLVLWAKRKLSWQTVLPLVPMLAMGAGAGLMTAWMESSHVGAGEAAGAGMPVIQHIVIAADAVWFYAGKLLYPHDLTFVYPQWDLGLDKLFWYDLLSPLAVLAVLGALWAIRKRAGRGALAAWLFFLVTLAPALGFIRVWYQINYSFVADHFQYLASLGVIVLVCGALALVARRSASSAGARTAVAVAAAGLPLALGVLTAMQCRVYKNAETLWNDVLAKNPTCWMAHNNLGVYLSRNGRSTEAIEHFEQSLEIRPHNWNARNNWGLTLADTGRRYEALEQYDYALKLSPDNANVYFNIAVVRQQMGMTGQAMAAYGRVLQITGGKGARTHAAMGAMLAEDGKLNEAIGHFEASLAEQPRDAYVHENLATALRLANRFPEALPHYRRAAELAPTDAKLQFTLAEALARSGDFSGAIAAAAKALAALGPGQEKLADEIRARIDMYRARLVSH